jgi:hypothetical protein
MTLIEKRLSFSYKISFDILALSAKISKRVAKQTPQRILGGKTNGT